MSEERELKPDISDDEAGPSQVDPVTPVKPKGAKINLIVQAPDNRQVQFALKPTSTFQKMFSAAAERFGYTLSLIRFTYNGSRVRAEQTPEEHDMVDEDVIDIHVQQVGGGQ